MEIYKFTDALDTLTNIQNYQVHYWTMLITVVLGILVFTGTEYAQKQKNKLSIGYLLFAFAITIEIFFSQLRINTITESISRYLKTNKENLDESFLPIFKQMSSCNEIGYCNEYLIALLLLCFHIVVIFYILYVSDNLAKKKPKPPLKRDV